MPLAATPSFSRFLIPALAGRFISGDEGHGPRQRPGYQVTPNLSLSCPMHAGNKTDLVQKMSPPCGEASGIRRDTSGEHQKKAYEKQIIRLKQRHQQTPISYHQTERERVAKYNYNRELPTQKVLDLLKAQLPQPIRTGGDCRQMDLAGFSQGQPPRRRQYALRVWAFIGINAVASGSTLAGRVRRSPRIPPTRAPNTAVISPPT